MSLSLVERGRFLKLFNRGGYILVFSTADFESFVAGCVGVYPVSKYSKAKGFHLSKGKALIAYCEDDATSDEDILILFSALLDYYEVNFKKEYDEPKSPGEYDSSYSEEYADLFRECRASIDRETGRGRTLFLPPQTSLRRFFDVLHGHAN